MVRKASRSWVRLGRRNATTRIQHTRMAVPATHGANAHETLTALWVSDPTASTAGPYGTYFGSDDHGPVQAVTTATMTRNGSSPRTACLVPALASAASATGAACGSTCPPKPSTIRGRQT